MLQPARRTWVFGCRPPFTPARVRSPTRDVPTNKDLGSLWATLLIPTVHTTSHNTTAHRNAQRDTLVCTLHSFPLITLIIPLHLGRHGFWIFPRHYPRAIECGKSTNTLMVLVSLPTHSWCPHSRSSRLLTHSLPLRSLLPRSQSMGRNDCRSFDNVEKRGTGRGLSELCLPQIFQCYHG